MIDFKQILFPVDMSEQVRRSAPFVNAMAERFGSEILMLYAQEPPMPIYESPEAVGWVSLPEIDIVRKKRQADFENFLAKEFSGLRVRRTLAEGDAAQEIVAHANANHVGLIMLPTHGHSRFRRFLLGSVTAKVLHDTECPVWTSVHTPEVLSRNPQRWERLLCAVDLDARDVRVIRWVAEFANERHLDVQLVHAVAGARDAEGDSASSWREFLFKIASEDIDELQKEAGTSFPVTVRAGKPEHVVHDVARELDADLVVIGRGDLQHLLGRLRTHAYPIIRESPCPVISV
jgi:nucleotide-binding universal stress UspA family protein